MKRDSNDDAQPVAVILDSDTLPHAVDLFDQRPPMPPDDLAGPGPADSGGPHDLAGPSDPLPPLPDKEYFKIGEAAKLVGVEPHVLRFWESEFSREIRPERTRSNQRMYRKKDLETFLRIKRLRYEERLELPGARERLRGEVRKQRADARAEREAPAAAEPVSRAPVIPEAARRLRAAVEELIRMVDEDERSE